MAVTCRGPVGRAASSALLTAGDIGLAHAVRLPGALHWDLPPPVVPSSLHQAAPGTLMVKGTVAVPNQSSCRVWRGPGCRAVAGRAPCSAKGTPSNTTGSSPPCRAPPSTVRQGTGSWALPQSSSWFVSPLKGAGLGPARDMQRSPTAWHRGASPTWHGQERESDRTL